MRPLRPNPRWSTERLAELEQLWLEGLTASQCARRLGESRNAIIGARYRNFPYLARTKKTKPALDQGREQAASKRLPGRHKPANLPAPAPLPAQLPASHGSVLLADLRSHHCRYPFGTPKVEVVRYCGAHKIAGSSYCASHHTTCYLPAHIR
jgi:GcrA cell cycle regulator